MFTGSLQRILNADGNMTAGESQGCLPGDNVMVRADGKSREVSPGGHSYAFRVARETAGGPDQFTLS